MSTPRNETAYFPLEWSGGGWPSAGKISQLPDILATFLELVNCEIFGNGAIVVNLNAFYPRAHDTNITVVYATYVWLAKHDGANRAKMLQIEESNPR